MKPSDLVEAALLGNWPEQVPFTAYSNKFFLSRTERELRNSGFCVIEQRVPLFAVETPDVPHKTIHYRGEDGVLRQRRVWQTPKGSLSEVYRVLPDDPRIPEQLLPWYEEYLFKGREDYARLELMIRSRRYYPCYEAFSRAQSETGGDVFLKPSVGATGYSPLMEIIYTIMGLERFSIEWHIHRDKVMHLYETLVEDHRKFYPLVAESPALLVNYCGNVSTEIIGLDRFEKYIVPHYNELADLLHERGKLLAVHLDRNNKSFATTIAESRIDCIEAFTPFPNSDMSVAEARAAWPDKILWINFPSATHLTDTATIEETTRQILREAAPGNRFLIGITEAVPTDRWQASFRAISRVISSQGRLPL